MVIFYPSASPPKHCRSVNHAQSNACLTVRRLVPPGPPDAESSPESLAATQGTWHPRRCGYRNSWSAARSPNRCHSTGADPFSRLLRFSNTASFHTDRMKKGSHWLSVDRVLTSAGKSTNPGLKTTTWRSQMHTSQRTDTRARTDAKGTVGYVHPHVVPGVCTSNGRATLKQTPHSGGMLHRNFKCMLSHCMCHQQYMHNRTHRPT